MDERLEILSNMLCALFEKLKCIGNSARRKEEKKQFLPLYRPN